MSKSDHRATQTLHALLQKRFPLAFPKHYDDLRPLKIGILADVIKQLPDVDPTALRRALANHTNRDGYLLALIHGRGDRRYDLNGQPAGTVTLEERAKSGSMPTKAASRDASKAARKAEHERVQQEIAARKAALIAQGITPESRSERKRRLAREAAKRAAHGPHAQTVSRDTKLERFRSSSGPVSTQPGPPEPATIKTTPGRPPGVPW
jgi:sRNA-binding protein